MALDKAFNPSSQGFDSPAGHQDKGPFFINVYPWGPGTIWRSRKHADWGAGEALKGNRYRLVVKVKRWT